MTKDERTILEEELKTAEENPQAPGNLKPGMEDFTEELVCSAEFTQGCEETSGDENQ